MTDFNNPTGHPIDRKLGRYEYKDAKSNKFYEVMYWGQNANNQPMFQIYWGRIGAKKPQGMQLLLWEAENKIDEKVRKGYRYVPGSFKSLAQQRHVGLTAVAKKVRSDLDTAEAAPPNRPKM